MILGGRLLPNFGKLKRSIAANESDHITLGGHLYTDFLNLKRTWTLSWDILRADQFQIILDLYMRQHREKVYLDLQIDAYNIYCKAKIEISEHLLKYNGVTVKNFTMKLIEKGEATFTEPVETFYMLQEDGGRIFTEDDDFILT